MLLAAATNNAGKIAEYKRILEPLGFEIRSQKELGIHSDPEETGSTFEENARIKAEAVLKLTGLPSLADDSGLCVNALHGGPGVYSARYSGGTPKDNIDKLLRDLKQVPEEKRGAYFICHICCAWPDGTFTDSEGRCEGRIDTAPRGNGGFGYDPVFVSDRAGSFGLASPEEKDRVSHRGSALRAFVLRLRAEHRI